MSQIDIPLSNISDLEYLGNFPSPPYVSYYRSDAVIPAAQLTTKTGPLQNTRKKDGTSISAKWRCDGSKIVFFMGCTVRSSFNLINAVHAEHSLSDLTKVVSEMEFQLDQWYASIPESMKFPLDDKPMSLDEELRIHLRSRYLYCVEMIYRPFIFHIYSAQPGTPHFEVATSLPYVEYARKCLQVSVSFVLSTRHDLRHAGTWYVVRLAFLAASLLLGAKTLREYVDLVPERTDDAIQWVTEYLEYWALHSASTRRMLELLSEMKEEVARAESLAMI
jgi:hypothetical protein